MTFLSDTPQTERLPTKAASLQSISKQEISLILIQKMNNIIKDDLQRDY